MSFRVSRSTVCEELLLLQSNDLMGKWILVRTRMFKGIRNGDAELAGRQARIGPFTSYAGYLAAHQREL